MWSIAAAVIDCVPRPPPIGLLPLPSFRAWPGIQHQLLDPASLIKSGTGIGRADGRRGGRGDIRPGLSPG
jgi:hypothetical protein